MKQTGIVDLPLHSGKCPVLLFPLMKNLSGKIVEVIVNEYNENEVQRFPVIVLHFVWESLSIHSSFLVL